MSGRNPRPSGRGGSQSRLKHAGVFWPSRVEHPCDLPALDEATGGVSRDAHRLQFTCCTRHVAWWHAGGNQRPTGCAPHWLRLNR